MKCLIKCLMNVEEVSWKECSGIAQVAHPQQPRSRASDEAQGDSGPLQLLQAWLACSDHQRWKGDVFWWGEVSSLLGIALDTEFVSCLDVFNVCIFTKDVIFQLNLVLGSFSLSSAPPAPAVLFGLIVGQLPVLPGTPVRLEPSSEPGAVECHLECQIECKSECRKGCQTKCPIECELNCQNVCQPCARLNAR